MTQFLMVRASNDLQLPPQSSLLPIPPEDAFLVEVAREHFGSTDGCRMVVAPSGSAAPLIDQAWEAQRHGREVGDTAFERMVAHLIRDGAELICWHGGDFRELPVVSSWEGFLDELRRQTRAQPADFWVRYRPPAAPETSSARPR